VIQGVLKLLNYINIGSGIEGRKFCGQIAYLPVREFYNSPEHRMALKISPKITIIKGSVYQISASKLDQEGDHTAPIPT
jgi:hypothetical protein